MTDSDDTMDPILERMLVRSDELHETLVNRLDGADFDPSPRGEACFGICSVSLEHALGVRVLMATGCPTSAVGLTRLQFEALTRAMWLLYAAGDTAIAKLTAPLTLEGEKAAKNLHRSTK